MDIYRPDNVHPVFCPDAHDTSPACPDRLAGRIQSTRRSLDRLDIQAGSCPVPRPVLFVPRITCYHTLYGFNSDFMIHTGKTNILTIIRVETRAEHRVATRLILYLHHRIISQAEPKKDPVPSSG